MAPCAIEIEVIKSSLFSPFPLRVRGLHPEFPMQQKSRYYPLGQCSIAGLKPDNDDFYGAITPKDVTLDSKGIAVVIADGVSASEGGKEASQIAVKQFLSDYYSTPDSWTAKLKR